MRPGGPGAAGYGGLAVVAVGLAVEAGTRFAAGRTRRPVAQMDRARLTDTGEGATVALLVRNFLRERSDAREI